MKTKYNSFLLALDNNIHMKRIHLRRGSLPFAMSGTFVSIAFTIFVLLIVLFSVYLIYTG